MPLFSHTIAEHCCTRCDHRCPDVSPNLAGFGLIISALAALPFGIVLLRAPWNLPWYDLVGIFAAELLLIFVAGLFSSLVMIPAEIVRHWKDRRGCRACGAPMRFAGRHFAPEGSKIPHWTDILVLPIFVALNIALWFILLRHMP
jgi:hypothetical protein